MKIGVPREIKQDEYRVSVVPAGVQELVRNGHQVLVQRDAGLGSGIDDEQYARAGASVVDSPDELYAAADLIVKVKEPLAREIPLMRAGQIVFTYFHLAADRGLTEAVLERGIVAIAYETMRLPDGELPLLTPMSEIAGRMAVHEGAKCLERPAGGMGILLAGVPGVPPAGVAIVGGGKVGANAAKVAAGLGAAVTVLDIDLHRLRYLDDVMPANVHTLYANLHTVEQAVLGADLVVGAVLVPGARTPVVIPEALVRGMKRGAAIVDVAIDQGGCVATARPTTHSSPTFVKHEVVHYCVTNMPGAVGRTSTHALTNASHLYLIDIANKGWRRAAEEDPAVAAGLNAVEGHLCCRAVAEAFDLPVVDWREFG
jgi:alanine dehydrogenase